MPGKETATRYPGIYAYTLAGGETRYLVRTRDREGRSVKRRGFTSITRARDALSRIEQEVRSGSYTAPAAGRATVQQCWDAYRAAKSVRLKPSSMHSLEVSWRTHVQPRWGAVPVARVSRRAVQEWVAELSTERSATIVIRAAEVLRGSLAVAVEDQRIAENPAAGLELPRKPKGKVGSARRYLSRVEVRAVADQCRRVEDRVLFLVLALGGLRWGEAVALRAQDVDTVRGRLRIERSAARVSGAWHVTSPKTYMRRSVPIPQHVVRELEALVLSRAGTDLMFPSPLDRTRFRALPSFTDPASGGRPNWFQGALQRAGVAYLSPHDLRHTAASLAVQSGAGVKMVQRMLGHESAAMTLDVYSDLFDSDLDDVAARADRAWDALGEA